VGAKLGAAVGEGRSDRLVASAGEDLFADGIGQVELLLGANPLLDDGQARTGLFDQQAFARARRRLE
jgi:hypothetical protein